MKMLILAVLVVSSVATAEPQAECIRRVKQELSACGEVCDQVMNNKKEVNLCYKACGEEARTKFIDECGVPLKR